MDRPPGLRAIIVYKLTKAPIQLTLALVLAVVGARLENGLLAEVRSHATAAWSVAVTRHLDRFATTRQLHFTVAALGADGAVTLVEGLLLVRGVWWAPWLVVGVMASLLPFELRALLHRIALGRVLLLIANLLVVTYLVRNARREFPRPPGVP